MNDRNTEPETLLEGIPVRREPPEAVRARVLAAVEHEWRRHKRRRWRFPLAVAATVVMSLAVAFLATRPLPGTVLHISHTEGVSVDGVLHGQPADGVRVDRGDRVEAHSNTRLLTADRTEVRLRAGTRVTWQGPEAVSLDSGVIYVDTGGRGSLMVHTPLGVVSDIGTTFMVTLERGVVEVAMRDGTAVIDSVHGDYTARAGEKEGDVVTVGPQRLHARVEPSSAGRWAWIHTVHPGYRHREVLPLLRDIAGDLGLELEFESPAVQAQALQSRLEGDLGGLSPSEALDVVLATTGFARRGQGGGSLVIGFQSSPD